MNRRRFNLVLFLIFMMVVVLAACSDSTAPVKENPEDGELVEEEIVIEVWDENEEEVIVKVLYPWGEDNFQQHIVETFKDALPKNITLECVCVAAQSEQLQEMNARGEIPDIMFANWGIDDIYELDMLEPVDDYVKKYGVDLDEFNQGVLAAYRAMDPEGSGRLIGMPTFVDTVGLFYNKEIFDLFGVPYPDPEKQMTWTELLDISAKLTGERNGVEYRGLEMGPGFTSYEATLPLEEFGINLTDPETGEVLITQSPEVKQYLELMQDFYNVPGLYDPEKEARNTDKFAQKTVAMTVSYPGYFRWGLGGEPEGVEMIDSAPIPVWTGEGKGPQVYAHPYVMNKYSENKDAAFQVMLAISKVNSMDPLTSPYSELSESSEHWPIYEGKNLEPFFNYESVMPPSRISKWDAYVDIAGSLHKLAEGDVDINTFLRVLEEESEIKIKDAMEQ